MFEIETLCYSFSLGYAFRSGLPFNAWGETAFIAVQSYIIVMLLHMYAGAKGSSLRAMVMAVGLPATAYAALKPELVTDGLLETLFSSQNALLLAARLPQVYANFANGSTGQLSLVTTALMVAGGLVRIFTTVGAEGADALLSSRAVHASERRMLTQPPTRVSPPPAPNTSTDTRRSATRSLAGSPADAGGRQLVDAHGVRPGHRDQRRHGAADRVVRARRAREEEGRVE